MRAWRRRYGGCYHLADWEPLETNIAGRAVAVARAIYAMWWADTLEGKLLRAYQRPTHPPYRD
jgi:hypothetical protein